MTSASSAMPPERPSPPGIDKPSVLAVALPFAASESGAAAKIERVVYRMGSSLVSCRRRPATALQVHGTTLWSDGRPKRFNPGIGGNRLTCRRGWRSIAPRWVFASLDPTHVPGELIGDF